jgi:hypothetical protein
MKNSFNKKSIKINKYQKNIHIFKTKNFTLLDFLKRNQTLKKKKKIYLYKLKRHKFYFEIQDDRFIYEITNTQLKVFDTMCTDSIFLFFYFVITISIFVLSYSFFFLTDITNIIEYLIYMLLLKKYIINTTISVVLTFTVEPQDTNSSERFLLFLILFVILYPTDNILKFSIYLEGPFLDIDALIDFIDRSIELEYLLELEDLYEKKEKHTLF